MRFNISSVNLKENKWNLEIHAHHNYVANKTVGFSRFRTSDRILWYSKLLRLWGLVFSCFARASRCFDQIRSIPMWLQYNGWGPFFYHN